MTFGVEQKLRVDTQDRDSLEDTLADTLVDTLGDIVVDIVAQDRAWEDTLAEMAQVRMVEDKRSAGPTVKISEMEVMEMMQALAPVQAGRPPESVASALTHTRQKEE